MNPQSEVTDEEFVPFLQSLGVTTFRKSFEWMLNDSNFAGVLHWLYENLDHNNALTTREEYRYAELEKKDLMSAEELDSAVKSIQEEYIGISLPGDFEALEDMKLDITMQKERLHLLEKQEKAINDLIKQNELINEELNHELTQLNSIQQQYLSDEDSASEHCLRLAEEVEDVTNSVIDVLADAFELYKKSYVDKDIAKRFFAFGPYESYKKSQSIFKLQFDFYTSKKFSKLHNSSVTDNLRNSFVEAKAMENRLLDAMFSYVESKAELSEIEAKLRVLDYCNHVHSTQIESCFMEDENAIEQLEQDELVLNQQIQFAVEQAVEARTKMAVDATIKSAMAVREQMHNDITYLLETTQEAFALDRIAYCAFRYELNTLEEFLQFSALFKNYINEESNAIVSRIESMNKICTELHSCETKLQSSDMVRETLCSLLKTNNHSPAKSYNDLQETIIALKDNIKDNYRKKEDALVTFKKASEPLRDYVWDGCTKRPNAWDHTVAALCHSLRHEMDAVDKRIAEFSAFFAFVKANEKQYSRKLWQWFLTDQDKLLAVVKQGVFRR